MLKHIEIIEKLSIGQKLALAADLNRLTDPAISSLGVPCVGCADVSEYLRRSGCAELPAPEDSIRSWNTELIGRIAEESTSRAISDGRKFVTSPDLRVGPFASQSAVSEDPELCGKTAAAYLGGISAAGGVGCLSDCSVKETDTVFLDKVPDDRALAEYTLEPFRIASESADFGYVATSSPVLGGGYRDVNGTILPRFLTKAIGGGKTVCVVNPSDTVGCVRDGAIAIGGSVSALSSALDRYHELTEGRDGVYSSREEIAAAVAAGTAIGDEAIDLAVDRALDIAFAAAEKDGGTKYRDASALALEAAEQSVVMLKNDGVLPYNARSVAIIGPAGLLPDLGELVSHGNYNGVRFVLAEGYDSASETETSVQSALEVASGADGVIVLLDCGKRNGEGASLPANRLKLVSELAAANKKTIAVVVGASIPDTSFDKNVRGVLMISGTGARRGEALLNIVTGRTSPSGRLAFSAYDGADEYFGYLKRNRDAGLNKVGSFVGYRHSDVSGEKAKYPFGHGLTYSSFEYSGLKAEHGKISFTLANTGGSTACEVAQVYIGKPRSSVVRPVKTLKGFAKVRLGPGEKTVVTIRIAPDDLAVYDPGTKEMKVEQGEYTVYVGASADDVRMTANISVGGEKLGNDNVAVSSYVKPESDVRKSGYGLSYKARELARTPAGIFAIVMAAVTFICDLVYVAFGIVSEVEAWADKPFDPGSAMFAINIVVLVLLNLLFVASVVAAIATRMKIKKSVARAERVASASDSWNVTELDGEVALGDLFVSDEAPVAEDETAVEKTEEYRVYADKSLNFASLSEKLSEYMTERGVVVDKAASRRILAALASSSLVIFRLKEEVVRPFLTTLGYFFGCADFTVDLASGGDASGVIAAIEAAKAYPHNVCFSALAGADAGGLDDYYTPFMRRFAERSPNVPVFIGGKYRDVPDNLRFICGISGGTDDLSLRIADAAAVVDINVTLTSPSASGMSVGIGYEQFVMLCDLCVGRLDFDENKWKKFDRIVGFVSSRSAYRIDNKLWRSMERYIAVFTECGGDETDALDAMIADRLIHGMALRVSGKYLPEDGSFLSETESALGEDNISECRKALKRFGLPDLV